MRKLLALASCIAFLSAGQVQAFPDLPMLLGGHTGTPPPAYFGPTDSYGSGTLVEYWGLDANASSYRGSKAINLCNVADAACADVNTSATTGLVPNTPVIGGVTCGTTVGVNVCTVKTFYGQHGASDQTQATIANRAIFVPSLQSGLPGTTTGPTTVYQTTNNIALAAPFTFIGAAERTGNTSVETGIVQCFGTSTAVMDFDNVANTANLFAGSVLTATATDSAFHTFQGVFNGASSDLAVNAVRTTGSAGTSGPSAGQPCYIIGNNGTTNGTTGAFLGGGIYELAPTTLEINNVDAGWQSVWGF